MKCWLRFLGIVVQGVLLTGCGLFGDDEPDAPAPPPPPVAMVTTGSVLAAVDANSGPSSKSFQFTANATFLDQNGSVIATPADTTYVWRFDNGDTLDGQSVDIQFADVSRIQAATVTVQTPNGTQVSDEISVTVFSESSLGPEQLSLPDRYSDINGDDSVDALDYLLLAQSVLGADALTDEQQVKRADITIDGSLGRDDLDLLGRALLTERQIPSAVFGDGPLRPFAKATVSSEALLSTSSDVALTIDSVPVEFFSRNIRGYAELVIPQALSGDTDVELVVLVDGVEADRIPFFLEPRALATADPLSMLNEYADLMVELHPVVAANYVEIYGDGQLAEIADQALRTRNEQFVALVRSLADQPQTEINVVTEYLLANGLGDSLASLRELQQIVTRAEANAPIGASKSAAVAMALSRAGGLDACEVVDSVCAFRRFNEAYADAGGLMSDICLVAALVAAPFTGGWSVVVAAACLTINSADVINTVLGDLSSKVDFGLILEATEKEPGRVFNLLPLIEIKDGTGICTAVGGQAVDLARAEVADTVADVAEAIVIRKLRVRQIRRILERLGSDGIQAFEDFIEDVVDRALPTDQLADSVIARFEPICERFGLRDGRLTGTTDPLNLLNVDASLGTFTPLGDGSADFQCAQTGPDGMPVGEVTITASKNFCETTVARAERVVCGGTEVTVTYGDNGTALDDIFAVEIGGQSFSTNTPVVAATGTVTLPSGTEQTVLMRGLAAPDGIGTYYISFAGATVLSGRTSGSDLTQGVTKTFVIRVN